MTTEKGSLSTSRFTVVITALVTVAGVVWIIGPDQRPAKGGAAERGKTQAPKARPLQKDIRKQTPVQVFMQSKLNDNTTILEGLMTNQFDQIVDAAEHLNLMSTATEWHVIQGPIYKQHSSEFRRSAKELKKAAKKKNLDGAALAYMHMTMTCINCHKFVRGTQLADGGPERNGTGVIAGRAFPFTPPR